MFHLTGPAFNNKCTKEQVLEKVVIYFGNVPVFIGDFKTAMVKIYEGPPEMPDTVVVGRLSHNGRVLSFRRDYGIVTDVHRPLVRLKNLSEMR